MSRHPDLSLRKPEVTSLSRATGFNKVQVELFYSKLQEILLQNNISPARIFNMDQTGISSVQKPGKILSQRGMKQVGKLISLEIWKTITVVCAMNSIGNYISPMFIFSRKRMVQTLFNGASFGSIGYCSFSGWIDTALFLHWLIHFQSQVKATPESKVLMMLDNHASHVSLPAINFCRKNNIMMLSIPPSTSHRLQPLDRNFFGPLKTYYNQEIEKWLLNHSGRRVSHFDVVGIFNKANLQSAMYKKLQKALNAQAFVPFNSHIFTDAYFAPANVTDNQDEQAQVDVGSTAAFFPSASVQVPVLSIYSR